MKKVVEQRDDMVFYLKMYPLIQIHPEAYQKSKAIICEKNNEKAVALLEDAYARKALPEPACETTALDETLRLGRNLGIDGTPTIIYEDGSRDSGALAADVLIQRLESRNK
jgi:thiol:disulfide interchange protein DsbC